MICRACVSLTVKPLHCSYASKDLFDPTPPGRRILFGWLQFGNGALALPREVTWHPQLRQLVYSPVPELAKLRDHSIGNLSHAPLVANATHSLGCAEALEVRAVFERPARATRLGVFVAADRSRRSGYWYFVDYKPPPRAGATYNVTVGRTLLPAGPGRLKRVMHNVDLIGADYETLPINSSDYKPCQSACDANSTCKAWTFVPRGCSTCGNSTCLLKRVVPVTPNWDNVGMTSGVKSPADCEDSLVTGKLALLPTDRTLTVHVFVDSGGPQASPAM